MRSSSFPNLSRYFRKVPNSFSSFKNSPALCTVAWIFFSFLTIPASDISFSTSLSENRATLLIEKSAKALWKLGYFFSITFQLTPAVKSDLVIRSKYSSSFLGGLTFQLGDTDSVEAFYIFMDFEFAPLRGLQGFSTEGSLGPFEHVSHKIS